MFIRTRLFTLAAGLLCMSCVAASAQFNYQQSNFGYSQYYNSQHCNRSHQSIWTIYTPSAAIPGVTRVPRPFPQLLPLLPKTQPPTIHFQSIAPAETPSGYLPIIEFSNEPRQVLNAALPEVPNMIVGEILVDATRDPATESSTESIDLVANIDDLSSPSDVVLSDQSDDEISATLRDSGQGLQEERQSFAALQAEMQRLQNEIASLTATNKEYRKELEGLKSECSALRKVAKGTPTDKELKKRNEAEIKKIKQNSAWAIAKARKETEMAKAALLKLKEANVASAKNKRTAATKKRKAMQKKKAAQEQKQATSKDKASKSARSSSNEKETVPQSRKAKSLAQLAEEKRKKRQRQAKKQPEKPKNSKQAAKKKEEKEAKPSIDPSMKAQIKRAVGKIKRRFDAKIERAKAEGGSDEEIAKLVSEMKIQMEKMEERIRSRFKNRK